MTNYEKIKGMSVEKMARINVREIYDGVWKQDAYMTSDYKTFGVKEGAIQHEFDWLNSEFPKVNKCNSSKYTLPLVGTFSKWMRKLICNGG